MNPELKDVWQHVRDLGLGALAHANRHAAYMGMENVRWPDLSVLQAAHAAELLIKARIAQEHPLLIFEQLPRSKPNGELLDLAHLFENGKTHDWSDLPNQLWATTGIKLYDRAAFVAFGKYRNGIQHFASLADRNPSDEALRFIFRVIDPFINKCWGLYAVDYDEDYEPYIYFVNALVRRKISFLVSPDAANCFEDWDVDWEGVSLDYKAEVEKRVMAAKLLAKEI